MSLFKPFVVASWLSAIPLSGHAAFVDFSDNFNGGASPLWSNSLGAWTAAGGVYNASLPSNSPRTYTALPFDFDTSRIQIDVDVNGLADGGIWLSTDGSAPVQNGVLLVLGGLGYGPSGGAVGGHALYWHPIVNGAVGVVGQVNNVFTPLQDYHVTVRVTGSLYEAYVDDNLISSVNLPQFSGGRVGLYDEWPATSFDNFRVVGTVVPEPTTWALMIGGLGAVHALVRRRRFIAS